MKLLKIIVSVLLVAGLAACGGGGGSPGNTGAGSGSGSGSGEQASPLATLDVRLSKSMILNSGNDFSEITVTALDANRNVMVNVPVEISLSPDGIFQRVTTGPSTDSTGRFVGQITIGSNKENRVLNVRVRSGTVERLTSVQVTGTQILVTALPATPQVGQNVSLSLSVRDSAGIGIPDARLSLSGNFGASGEVTTLQSGGAIVSVRAPSTAGSYGLVVSGFGVNTSQTILVGSALPPALGPVSSVDLAPNPTQVLTNSVGSTVNRSRLVASFLTIGNSPVENMRVRFDILAPALGAGEFISTGSALVYSNTSGVATADYVPGTRSSPTNGVSLRICYDMNDFAVSDCPNERLANLTVAGTPLSITIGENNELNKGLANLTYIRQHIVQVVDAAGNAVNDAVVSVSVDITHYGKGLVWNQLYQGFTALQAPSIRDVHSDDNRDPLPSGSLPILQASDSLPDTNRNIWCINEDLDRNGSLRDLEDVNGNGDLEPRKAEVAVAFPSGNRTNSNGQVLVDVTYPQNMGRWLAYTLRATTGVQGSEGDVSKPYMTEVLLADVENGSFLTPPYGVKSCSHDD